TNSLDFSRRRLLQMLSFTALGAGLTVLPEAIGLRSVASAQVKPGYQRRLQRALEIGTRAYIWGYPLIYTKRFEIRRLAVTAPFNQFSRSQNLTTARNRAVVAPNNDTLYSTTLLDLRQEPVVLSVPDTNGRYYSLQFFDNYTNTFAYVGRRVTGTSAGEYAIVGPNWCGSLPSNFKQIKSPVNMVFILGRTLIDGEADLPAARAVQQQYTLVPLSRYGTPPVEVQPPPTDRQFLNPNDIASSGIAVFDELGEYLVSTPPRRSEASLLRRFASIDIGPNRRPSEEITDEATLEGLRQAIPAAEKLIDEKWSNLGTTTNGWSISYELGGDFRKDYLLRAAVAKYGIFANVPEESLYFGTDVDNTGNPLVGSNRYVLTFDQLPPVNAFWSLTLYGFDRFFYDNPLNRYAIGDRTPGLQYNADGTLTLYIQNEAPAGNESNWFPAPRDRFSLTLRTYEPQQILLDGQYQPPSVVQIESQ
ncbi:DUF1254 domain-containing protein, partial [Leptolyngbya sp. FACHB-36]|uniref:DUF1254 domain-containing protein n=1 Tax=Leptolyngbya sp. FACHB-36 TaxID=2692808 RepID=UPI001A7E64A6